MNDLSDEHTEFLITDRLSHMRFPGLGLGDKAPDRNTNWTFREHLKAAGVMDDLFAVFDQQVTASGYHATQGQLVDASLIRAPRQRLSQEEKTKIKSGKPASEIWDNPNKAAQKDISARWTMKCSQKTATTPKGQVDIAIPYFGDRSHIMIDRKNDFIRAFKVTDASRHDGAQLKDLVRTDILATGIWADSAYHSKKNDDWLSGPGRVSHIHRKKPKGRPMPTYIKRRSLRRPTTPYGFESTHHWPRTRHSQNRPRHYRLYSTSFRLS